MRNPAFHRGVLLAALAASRLCPAADVSEAARRRARDFIENEGQFHLGFLPTEQSNPITATLEEDFKRSALAGVQCLQRADRQIPITMRHVFAGAAFENLVSSMVATLRTPKGRIIFSGCGATGRLSILLESMWRDFFHRRAADLTPGERALADRSASIMTGGDFALIKSVESFEDSMAGGERQAAALAVGADDTFVAITEGGETSSVLGTLRYAAAHGARCFLVFNNPADLLRARLARCREAIDNPKVTVIDLYCGSMGLAGSTRMQATTSEQLLGSCALEAALCRVLPRFAQETAGDCTVAFETLLATLESPAVRADIAEAIEFEKSVYERKGRITYFADDCMLDLFTDTTERSPTFMLPPFRATDETHLAQSWAFVKNPLHGTEDCWRALFHRDVRCLEWTAADYAAPGMPAIRSGEPPRIGRRFLMRYPIGNEDTPERYTGCESVAVIVRAGTPDAAFEAAARKQAARFGSVRLFAVAPAAPSPLEIWKHLAVKLTFNNLSTGTMASLGRVAGNWMSWVSISNKKLIDRGIRLLAELGGLSYEEAAERLFAADEWIQAQDWTGRETPCAVQVALEKVKGEKVKGERGKVKGEVVPTFSLRLGTGGTNAPLTTVTAAEMATCTTEPIDCTNGTSRIVWRGHPVCGAAFTVTATRAPGLHGAEWTFAYANNESGLFVEEVSFPEWTVPRTDTAKVFCPRICGTVLAPAWTNIAAGQVVARAGPGFGGPHVVAVLADGDGPSFYLDQRGDARCHATRFEIAQGDAPGTCVLKNICLLPLSDETKRAFRLPYPSVTAEFHGGWFEAASLYRDWVRGQDWYRKAAAREFAKLRDVSLWMWNRGRSETTVPPVLKFKEDTGLKVALDWYWWHNIPYDTYYPGFWPPREPIASFQDAVARLHAAGCYVQPYTNGMLWDRDDPRWAEGGDDCTLVLRNGAVKSTVFNPYTRQRQAWMCGEAPQFQDRLRRLERTIRATGMDGVYMDMIGHAAHGCCYNPRHRHAPGGGRHLTDGYRAFVEKVRADNPGFYLSTEEQGEAYLDLFESFIFVHSSHERFGHGLMPAAELVPAFQAVYHGAAVLFGSFATIDDQPPWDERWGENPYGTETTEWETRYPDQFAVELSRGVVWGQQPTVHKFLLEHATAPRFAADYAFLKDTARFYHANRDLLFDGEMRAPGVLTCATARVKFLRRSCYTKPEDVKEAVQPALPTVFHSVWRAKDGRTAAVLCNWSRTEQRYDLKTPDLVASGILPARSWRAIDTRQERSEGQ